MVVGKGANQWTTGDVAEVTTRYLCLIEGALANPAPAGLVGLY